MKSIKEEMFVRHTHAEIVNDQNPSQIVYREADVKELIELMIDHIVEYRNVYFGVVLLDGITVAANEDEIEVLKSGLK